MKTADFKFLVLAVLCMLLVIPILGYVQKQAPPGRTAQTADTSRREGRRWQRQALRDWLQHNVPVALVTISPDDPQIVDVVLKPEVTHAQIVAQARRVRQIMAIYFHEGQAGAVTLVNLHASRGRDMVSVITGLPGSGNSSDVSWHLVRGSDRLD